MSWALREIEQMWENEAESLVDLDVDDMGDITGSDEQGWSFILPLEVNGKIAARVQITVKEIDGSLLSLSILYMRFMYRYRHSV